jgi:hypothetical protein
LILVFFQKLNNSYTTLISYRQIRYTFFSWQWGPEGLNELGIMATSISGGGSRREPPTMDRQLVSLITCGCESSALFLLFTKSNANPHCKNINMEVNGRMLKLIKFSNWIFTRGIANYTVHITLRKQGDIYRFNKQDREATHINSSSY